jgi:hypothetical protein
MTTQLEKAAKALYEYGSVPGQETETWEFAKFMAAEYIERGGQHRSIYQPLIDEAMSQARAVVESLRDPTSYMIADAANVTGQQSYGDIWRIMCDAILNEEQPK